MEIKVRHLGEVESKSTQEIEKGNKNETRF